MALSAWRVEQIVRDQWRKVVAGLQQINPRSTVRPSQPTDVIRLSPQSPSGQIKLDVAPVVLNLPERANGNTTNLFVVLQGWLSFDALTSTQVSLPTADFGTRVAYFRRKSNQLDHVYGAHFDFDNGTVGHPICHGQVASQLASGNYVRSEYQLGLSLVDSVDRVMRTVRTPTAQMDVFSMLRQICADHLVGGNPAPPVVTRFHAIANACDIAGPVRPHLRSLQWYP